VLLRARRHRRHGGDHRRARYGQAGPAYGSDSDWDEPGDSGSGWGGDSGGGRDSGSGWGGDSGGGSGD
jgi:hypothetical protein